jgi:hypothetical protein
MFPEEDLDMAANPSRQVVAWLSLTPAQRQRFAEAQPERYASILLDLGAKSIAPFQSAWESGITHCQVVL